MVPLLSSREKISPKGFVPIYAVAAASRRHGIDSKDIHAMRREERHSGSPPDFRPPFGAGENKMGHHKQRKGNADG